MYMKGFRGGGLHTECRFLVCYPDDAVCIIESKSLKEAINIIQVGTE